MPPSEIRAVICRAIWQYGSMSAHQPYRPVIRCSIAASLALAVALPAMAEERGPSLYKNHCASCHGTYGRGDGPVAASLKVEVPDLTRIAIRHGGQFPDEQVRKIIDGRTTRPPHGPRNMPVWGDVFTAAGGDDPKAQKRASDLVELLTEYLRSIQVQ
jgi:mono/diheme cytochrome c family protein